MRFLGGGHVTDPVAVRAKEFLVDNRVVQFACAPAIRAEIVQLGQVPGTVLRGREMPETAADTAGPPAPADDAPALREPAPMPIPTDVRHLPASSLSWLTAALSRHMSNEWP